MKIEYDLPKTSSYFNSKVLDKINPLCNDLDDLFLGIKPVLIVGRLTGAFPIDGIFGNHSSGLSIKWSSVSTWQSFGMVLGSSINFIILLQEKNPGQDAVGKLLNSLGICFHCNALFVYVQFWRKRTDLLSLIKKWNDSMARLQYGCRPDTKLPIHSKRIVLFIMLYAIPENILSDISAISEDVQEGNRTGSSVLDKWYQVSMGQYHNLIPYHWTFSFLYYIWEKVITYNWNLVDIFIIVLCRALAFRFKALNDQIASRVGTNNSLEDEQTISDVELTCIRKDFMILRDLTDEMSKLLSPFFLSCYFLHLLLISVQLYRWLTSSAGYLDIITTLYIRLSFIQFVMRTFLVTYFAVEVNKHAERILKSLQKTCSGLSSFWMSSQYQQLERLVSSVPVGVEIFGVVLVTRRIILSIVSFIFSFQIVLLQAGSTNQSAY